MTRVIDAHVHLWQADDGFHEWLAAPGLERIHTNFTGYELGARTTLAEVDAVILVEGGTPHGEDTEMLLAQTRASSRFAGVVAWVDPASPEIESWLQSLLSGPDAERVVGFRSQVQGQGDDYTDRADVRAGIRAIGETQRPFELVIRPAQRQSILSLVDALPATSFVLDHLGNPDYVDGRPSPAWIDWSSALAARAHVAAKLSALHSSGAPVEGREELVSRALEIWGPERLAWGSDWPVSLLNSSYANAISFARCALNGLTRTERSAIFGGTAERLYRLDAP